MNPSTSGWITKYFKKDHPYLLFKEANLEKIYRQARAIGFVYGHIDLNFLNLSAKELVLSQDEMSKICFLQLLEQVYYYRKKVYNADKFMAELIEFYGLMIPTKKNFFKRLIESKKDSDRVEQIFQLRWKSQLINPDKNQPNIFNTTLLLVDFIAFDIYLLQSQNPKEYANGLVYLLTEIVLTIKDEQTVKNENDQLLIKYLNKILNHANYTATEDLFDIFGRNAAHSELVKKFLSDFIVINSWNNDHKSIQLPQLDEGIFARLQISETYIAKSQNYFHGYLSEHQYDYSFFKSTKLFSALLQNTTSAVETLLIRNKKRLLKEISKNGQLMQLLLESATRDLSSKEKKMVRKQLIEVCKTVPSLAIFFLPGGSLLLPIILKFIPKLLPSSFNENLDH